jgi:hypothetical protein
VVTSPQASPSSSSASLSMGRSWPTPPAPPRASSCRLLTDSIQPGPAGPPELPTAAELRKEGRDLTHTNRSQPESELPDRRSVSPGSGESGIGDREFVQRLLSLSLFPLPLAGVEVSSHARNVFFNYCFLRVALSLFVAGSVTRFSPPLPPRLFAQKGSKNRQSLINSVLPKTDKIGIKFKLMKILN